MGLKEYNRKRDFKKTTEPRGSAAAKKAAAAKPSFVVQKHAASHLHYDFRLEMEGVLRSWAVPKGPSLDPQSKRLAVETEDHPMAYRDFEGVIPEGEYGGGSVIVWESGTWECEGDPVAAYRKGSLTFVLRGRKLKGTWHLVRTRRGAAKGARSQWLLFKSHDKYARSEKDFAVTQEKPLSVLSRRSVESVAKRPPRVWR